MVSSMMTREGRGLPGSLCRHSASSSGAQGTSVPLFGVVHVGGVEPVGDLIHLCLYTEHTRASSVYVTQNIVVSCVHTCCEGPGRQSSLGAHCDLTKLMQFDDLSLKVYQKYATSLMRYCLCLYVVRTTEAPDCIILYYSLLSHLLSPPGIGM